MLAILIALAALCVAAFSIFAFYSTRLHQAKPAALRWRGIVKIVSLQGEPFAIQSYYRRWFISFWSFYASACVFVGVLVWATDHSFFVVIFPLLFYYFFVRYFLWEKADLSD